MWIVEWCVYIFLFALGLVLVSNKLGPSRGDENAAAHFSSRGFFMTNDMRAALGPDVWDGLLRFYRNTYSTWTPYAGAGYDPGKNNRHHEATVRVFEVLAQDGLVRPQPEPERGTTPLVPDAVLSLAARLLAFLPRAEYKMKVWFISDLGATDQEDTALVRRKTKLFCKHRDFAALAWHQDKTEALDNAYLFFALLESAGNIAPKRNLLRIGCVDHSKLKRRPAPQVFSVPDDSDVQLLAETRGHSGSGYLIDENWRKNGQVLVHTHELLSFAYLNFDPTHNPGSMARTFRDGEAATRQNYVDAPEFCVRRVKVIVRVIKV
jgi:hypothetical protein